jgi:hypothetical protein
MLGLMLLSLILKGLLTYKRMVIRPLGPCLSIGLCTIALFVGRMGIKRVFATTVQGKCGELVLLGLWLFIDLFMAWTLVRLRMHNLWTCFITLFLVSYTMLVDMFLVLLVLVLDILPMVLVLVLLL